MHLIWTGSQSFVVVVVVKISPQSHILNAKFEGYKVVLK